MSPNSHHIFPFKFATNGEEQRANLEAQEANQKSYDEVQDIMTQTVCLNVTNHFILVLRLCLAQRKMFFKFKCKIFSGENIFKKENIFKCLIAFQKML